MKVLIVTRWPLSTAGGTARLAKEIARSLAGDCGLDVLVATGSAPNALPSGLGCATPIREVTLPFVWRPGRTPRASAKSLVSTAYLQGLDALASCARPDVLVYMSHFSSCGLQTAAVAAQLGIPLVLVPAVHLDDRLHTSRAARRFYRAAALVVSLSDIERRWLLDRAGVSPERVLTLGCGWRECAPRPARPISIRSPVHLLTVGRLVTHKQIDHQLEAVAYLRGVFKVNAHLTIAGAVHEPPILARLMHLVQRRRVLESVQFVTDCTDDVIRRLHADADFFLFTSRSESFGLAVLEAIAHGTVPIVYPHPVYRGLIESSGFGVITRHASPKALAETALRALTTATVHCEERRLRWLADRSWQRVAAPLAHALARIPP